MGKGTRHIVGIVGLVALVATGAACGGGSPTISAGLIARAAAATGDEDSTRFVVTMDLDGQAIEAEGVMNFAVGNPDLVRGIVRTGQTGGAETRPVNASVNWIIRAI